MAYATIADLEAYNANIDVSDTVEIQRMLDRASEWVDDSITIRPRAQLNADNIDVLRRATLAIVEAYAYGTETAQIVGASGGGVRIGSFSIDKDASAGVALPIRAYRVLMKAGFLNSRVVWR